MTVIALYFVFFLLFFFLFDFLFFFLPSPLNLSTLSFLHRHHLLIHVDARPEPRRKPPRQRMPPRLSPRYFASASALAHTSPPPAGCLAPRSPRKPPLRSPPPSASLIARARIAVKNGEEPRLCAPTAQLMLLVFSRRV